MKKNTLRKGRSLEHSVHASKRRPKPIATMGEIFHDGMMIEPVREDSGAENLKLLFWDGEKAISSQRIFHGGYIYEAAAIHSSVLRDLMLPTQSVPYGSARQLLADISNVLDQYSGFPEYAVAEGSRFILASSFLGAQTAPRLSIFGPETSGGLQFFDLLRCLCWHPLRLTGVTVGGLCSLPMGWRLTLLIRQEKLNPLLWQFLNAIRNRDEYIPRGGRLLDLHCAIATYSEQPAGYAAKTFPGIEIPVIRTSQKISILDDSARLRIASDFQAKLLTYRLTNYQKVLSSTFDAPELMSPIREIARSLGACTPDDPDLQQETINLLQARDAQIRSDSWVDITTVIIEVLIALVHEAKSRSVYVGEIAKLVSVTLEGRGDNWEVEARAVGEKLRLLHFKIEPRDSHGFKLLLTPPVSRRIHRLARDYEVPSIADGVKRCEFCNFGEAA